MHYIELFSVMREKRIFFANFIWYFIHLVISVLDGDCIFHMPDLDVQSYITAYYRLSLKA